MAFFAARLAGLSQILHREKCTTWHLLFWMCECLTKVGTGDLKRVPSKSKMFKTRFVSCIFPNWKKIQNPNWQKAKDDLKSVHRRETWKFEKKKKKLKEGGRRELSGWFFGLSLFHNRNFFFIFFLFSTNTMYKTRPRLGQQHPQLGFPMGSCQTGSCQSRREGCLMGSCQWGGQEGFRKGSCQCRREGCQMGSCQWGGQWDGGQEGFRKDNYQCQKEGCQMGSCQWDDDQGGCQMGSYQFRKEDCQMGSCQFQWPCSLKGQRCCCCRWWWWCQWFPSPVPHCSWQHEVRPRRCHQPVRHTRSQRPAGRSWDGERFSGSHGTTRIQPCGSGRPLCRRHWSGVPSVGKAKKKKC